MKKEGLEKLIEIFFTGTVTEDDRRDLEKWYASFENDKGFISKLSGAEKEELESKLLQRINQNIAAFEESKTTQRKDLVSNDIIYPSENNTSRFLYSYKIAAVFIAVILLAALAYKLLQVNMITHTTANGQMLHITLPDSSTVILNGNSKLTYKDKWSRDGHRDVFLDGEAFFSVMHFGNDQKFIVHTSDEFNVEVLGTEFNVSKRRSGTRVVLSSGKICLNIESIDAKEKLIMKPGDLVEFEDEPSNYIRKEVNAELYYSWKEGRLLLDHTSLREILIMLQDNYGLIVTVSDKDLLDQKISGTIPAKELNLLLRDIAETYNVQISRNKNAIKIQ